MKRFCGDFWFYFIMCVHNIIYMKTERTFLFAPTRLPRRYQKLNRRYLSHNKVCCVCYRRANCMRMLISHQINIIVGPFSPFLLSYFIPLSFKSGNNKRTLLPLKRHLQSYQQKKGKSSAHKPKKSFLHQISIWIESTCNFFIFSFELSSIYITLIHPTSLFLAHTFSSSLRSLFLSLFWWIEGMISVKSTREKKINKMTENWDI